MARYRNPINRNLSLIRGPSFWPHGMRWYQDVTPEDMYESVGYYTEPRVAVSTPSHWNFMDHKVDPSYPHHPNAVDRRHRTNLNSQHSPERRSNEALEDAWTWSSATPPNLKEMLLEHERLDTFKPSMIATQSPLLLLPRKIRDMIYAYILIPSTPMELAPFKDCECNLKERLETIGRRQMLGQTKCGDDFVMSDRFHTRKWRCEYAPARAFLRVCRQIYREAPSIYYGQPFRFSDKAGWAALYFWLEAIGPRNRRLVRDITVCHPALAQTHCLISHLGDFSIPIPNWNIFRGYLRNGNIDNRDEALTQCLDIAARWPGWTTIPRTADLLAEIKRLKNISPIIKRSRMYANEDSCDFPTLTNHPVHAYLKQSLPATKLSIINFLKDWDVREPEYNEQFSLEAMYNSESPVNEEGRRFFSHVEDLGWDVEEMRYDVNESYPTEEGVYCANREVCTYIHKDTNPSFARCDCAFED